MKPDNKAYQAREDERGRNKREMHILQYFGWTKSTYPFTSRGFVSSTGVETFSHGPSIKIKENNSLIIQMLNSFRNGCLHT